MDSSWYELTAADLPPLEIETLKSFGFQRKGEGWLYEEILENTAFLLQVLVISETKAYSRVWDSEAGEPYVLHRVGTAQGAFVGKVRQACKECLAKIAEKCSCHNGKNDNELLRQILQFVAEKYQDELEYPWEDKRNAVIRHKLSGKWYVLFMLVQPKKLGLAGEKPLQVMNLHGLPEKVKQLVDYKKYLPGYHMNKKTWYTICLDGSVSLAEIIPLLEESYRLAAGK